jgi:putative membrane protein
MLHSFLFSAAIYPGIDGFLGTRASLTLDILVTAMLFVVSVLCWSVYQVKFCRRYRLHKWTQISLGITVLIVVVLFEIDVRLHGWEMRASGGAGRADEVVWYALYAHLTFAVSAILLWPTTIVLALRNFPNPPHPDLHSRIHVPLARTSAIVMVLTAIWGWIFYWLAFVR